MILVLKVYQLGEIYMIIPMSISTAFLLPYKK